MIGISVVVVIMVALVALAALPDRGRRERRRIRRIYGSAMLVMAEFEQSGGRVQELDHATDDVRRQTLRTILVSPAFAALALILQQLLGFPVWIAALVIAAYIVLVAAFHWVVASIVGFSDGETRRSGREVAGGLVAVLIKGLVLFAGVLAAHGGAILLNDGIWLPGLGYALVGVLSVTYSYIPAAGVERLIRKRREIEFAKDAKTDAVLYLRSFADDEFRLFTLYSPPGPRFRFLPGRVRFEEFLVSSLYGPSEIISVGRPGERLPSLGASRTYWDQDNWRDAIRATASRVEALIVLAGRTSSLAWEVSQLRDLGLLGKTLILFPPDDDAATAERYAFIADVLDLPANQRLPAELNSTLTGLAFSRTGDPVHCLSCGRDWSSYLATTMFYFLALAGQVRLDPQGALTLVDELTDDPYFQAAYLLDNGREADARELISDAAALADSASILIARAWVALELDQDSTRARDLLMVASELIMQDPGAGDNELDLQEALTKLDAIENGLHPPRELLRQRYPRDWRRVNPVRSGKVRIGRGPGVRFFRTFQAIGRAEETGDQKQALQLAQRAQDIAIEASLPTLVAFAEIQQAESLLALDRLDEAAAAYLSASWLRGAPRVSVSALMPSIDPVDIVDEALDGLCNVAAARKDEAERVLRLLELRKFREEYRSPEDTAWTAIELCRAYGMMKSLEEARVWGQRAQQEMRSIGHVDGAAQATYWDGMVERDSGDQDAALAAFLRAAEDGQSAGNGMLERHARRDAGALLVSAGRLSDASVEYARSLQLALELGDMSACLELMDSLASTQAPRTQQVILSAGVSHPVQLGLKAAQTLVSLSRAAPPEKAPELIHAAIAGAHEVLRSVPTETLVEHDGWRTVQSLARGLASAGDGDLAADYLEVVLEWWPAPSGAERETESDFGRRMLATQLRRFRSHSAVLGHEVAADPSASTMFGLYSEPARRAIVLANAAARSRHHAYMGTEHILFGLIDAEDSQAQQMLHELSVPLESVRSLLDSIVGHGSDAVPSHVPFTPRAKDALELGFREAKRLDHDYIGTGHLLLGLLREGEGVAASVLHELGAELSRARELLGANDADFPG